MFYKRKQEDELSQGTEEDGTRYADLGFGSTAIYLQSGNQATVTYVSGRLGPLGKHVKCISALVLNSERDMT